MQMLKCIKKIIHIDLMFPLTEVLLRILHAGSSKDTINFLSYIDEINKEQGPFDKEKL